jgi:hypothetical protein
VVAGDGEEVPRKEVIEMPFGDGTGPLGLGPLTGRAAGYCTGSGRPGFANPAPGYRRPYGYAYSRPVWPSWGYRVGRGFGRGLGRGSGRGWWRRGFYGYRW